MPDSMNPYESPRVYNATIPVRVKSLVAGPLLSLSVTLFVAAMVASSVTVVPSMVATQFVIVASLAGLGAMCLGLSFYFHLKAKHANVRRGDELGS